MPKRVAILDDYQGAAASQPHWQRLADRIVLEVYRDTVQREDALIERLRPYSIVVAIRERTRFSASVLKQLPALELLSLTGRNSGQADMAAAREQKILVTQTEGSSASTIELTMAFILSVAHRVVEEDRAIRRGLWQTGIGFELAGKTLGVIGLGRIGAPIAAFGKSLGMRVLGWSSNLTEQKASAAGATYVPLDDLLRESDVVTLHLRLSERTKGIISARHLSLLKPTACLVNTARGPLVDEEALVKVLRERRIRSAALDVYETEPLPVDHPLRTLENVVLTPHMGYVTAESYDQFFKQAIDNIEAYLDGRIPPGAINPEVIGEGSRRKSAASEV
jgi:phosphoglycerate dehydrogenase-like enzyme